MPETSHFSGLQKHWTPFFNGVTTFYEGINVAFKPGVTGCPLITDHALSVLEAEVVEQIDLGSHTIFVGNVLSSEVLKQGPP